METKSVRIELKVSEALVLAAWLSRFNESRNAAFEDQSEERALWNLESSLEKVLIAPLRGDYTAALRDAREELRDDD